MGRKNAAELYIDDPEDAGRHVRTVQTQWGMSFTVIMWVNPRD